MSVPVPWHCVLTLPPSSHRWLYILIFTATLMGRYCSNFIVEAWSLVRWSPLDLMQLTEAGLLQSKAPVLPAVLLLMLVCCRAAWSISCTALASEIHKDLSGLDWNPSHTCLICCPYIRWIYLRNNVHFLNPGKHLGTQWENWIFLTLNIEACCLATLEESSWCFS